MLHLLMSVGGGLYHMRIPGSFIFLMLSCPSLPILRQKSFHKVRRTKRSFLSQSRNCIWSSLFLSGKDFEKKKICTYMLYGLIHRLLGN